MQKNGLICYYYTTELQAAEERLYKLMPGQNMSK